MSTIVLKGVHTVHLIYDTYVKIIEYKKYKKKICFLMMAVPFGYFKNAYINIQTVLLFR